MPGRRKSLLIVLDAARHDETHDALNASSLHILRDAARVTLTAPSCWTVPSVASMLTGLFPSEHGRQWPLDGACPDVPTIADLLERAGGSFLMLSGNNLCGPPLLPLRDDHVRRPHDRRRLTLGLQRCLCGLDYGSRTILRAVEGLADAHELPHLLVLHLQEAHHPYLPPPTGLWPASFDPSARARYGLGHLAYYLGRRAQAWEFAAHADDRAWADARARYAECIRYVIGIAEGVLRAYERAGALDDTLAIITADHGEHLGEHGLADHQASLHEELLNCPCALIAPQMQPDAVLPGRFQHTDLLPTICAWLGVPTEGWQPACEALDLLDPANARGHAHAFAEWAAWGGEQRAMLQRRNPSYDLAPLDRDLVAVRDDRWKLTRGSDGSEALFDLHTDPREQHDLSAREPEVVEALARELARWTRAVRAPSDKHPPEGDLAAVELRLRELGYA